MIAENNRWAYSTPTTGRWRTRASWTAPPRYGCFGDSVDGNDVLAVYEVTRQAIERARAGEGPTLIEADTMRMRGHAEHDDMKYVPARAARGLGRRRTRSRATSGTCSGTASPRRASSTAIVAALERSLYADVDAALASPFPAPETALPNVYGDREVAAPVPPLVAEWERRKGGA